MGGKPVSISFKKSTTKTNINHNNRKFTEAQKDKNNHIDYYRSDKNIYLVQKDLKKIYEDEFNPALEKYNEKQKRNDRKIDSYYNHIKDSKKTALQQEMIIQVGDKDDFIGDENYHWEVGSSVLEEWFQGFEERNPNLKVFNAVIHNDEATPHLHINFVPVASGYKRGLEKQVAFDRAIKQQDKTLNKTRPFADWREKEVDVVAKILKEKNIERKIVGTNNYKDVNDYKKRKDLEKEIKQLDKKLEMKKDELIYLNNDSAPDKDKLDDLKGNWEIVKVEVPTGEKTLFGKDKMKTVEKRTDNVVMSEDKYQELRKVAKKSLEYKNQLDVVHQFDFFEDWALNEQQNQDLKKENKELNSEINSLKYKLINKSNDLNKQLNINNSLKAQIDDLRQEISLIYKSTKNFIKKHTSDIQGFKDVFKFFADDVTDKIDEKGLNNHFKEEFNKDQKKEKQLERKNKKVRQPRR